MMTPEERDVKIIMDPSLREIIAVAIRAAEDDMKERCAKIAEDHPSCVAATIEDETCVNESIAAAIRNLK